MKEFIKKFDKKYLKSILSRFYFNTITKFNRWLKINKITQLPKIINKNWQYNARFVFFKSVENYLNINRINGVYCEFGCHTAITFRFALRTIGLPFKQSKIHKFYAFDSFEGMPEPQMIDKQKIWRKGMNFTSEEKFKKLVKNDLHRIKIVKGFFSSSLKNFDLDKDDKVAMAYIDCDYYSSTVDCLNFLENKLLHGSIIAFDDWNCFYGDPKRGQRLAFEEFKSKTKEKYSFNEFDFIKSGGKSFIVLEKNKIGKEIL
tara:strand:- start:8 stop:784 length:777 start_codon:yes stop_codon:yes gene_type:complete